MLNIEKSGVFARKSEGILLDFKHQFLPQVQFPPVFSPPWVEPKPAGSFLRPPWQVFREWRRRQRSKRKFIQGFTPISQFSPDDVFIVGYPKSGNTWFQDLITAVVYGVNPAYAPPTLAHSLVPDVHGKPFYQRIAKTMYFKSHHLPRPEYKRVVYLLRDGRDAMVSFYHYNRATDGSADLKEMVQTGKGVLQGKWHDHVKAWLANPYRAQMIVIRYEDLKRNAAAELERFCAFAGVERERNFLENVAEQAAFEKMQKREIQSGAGHPGWPKDKLFRRRGIVGSYRDEMPPEVLNAFMAEAGDTLAKCGYRS